MKPAACESNSVAMLVDAAADGEGVLAWGC